MTRPLCPRPLLKQSLQSERVHRLLQAAQTLALREDEAAEEDIRRAMSFALGLDARAFADFAGELFETAFAQGGELFVQALREHLESVAERCPVPGREGATRRLFALVLGLVPDERTPQQPDEQLLQRMVQVLQRRRLVGGDTMLLPLWVPVPLLWSLSERDTYRLSLLMAAGKTREAQELLEQAGRDAGLVAGQLALDGHLRLYALVGCVDAQAGDEFALAREFETFEQELDCGEHEPTAEDYARLDDRLHQMLDGAAKELQGLVGCEALALPAPACGWWQCLRVVAGVSRTLEAQQQVQRIAERFSVPPTLLVMAHAYVCDEPVRGVMLELHVRAAPHLSAAVFFAALRNEAPGETLSKAIDFLEDLDIEPAPAPSSSSRPPARAAASSSARTAVPRRTMH